MPRLSVNEGAACNARGLLLPQRQPAGARIGPGSAANYWAAAAGEVYDMQDLRCFVGAFWRSGQANNQTVFACSTATTGFFVIHGSSRDLRLFWRGAGGGSVLLHGNLFLGLNWFVLAQRADSSLWFWMNGGPATSITPPGVYTAGGASAIFSVLKTQGENSFPATQSSVLYLAVVDQPTDISDELGTHWSGQANALDRWHAPPDLRAHAQLTAEYNWEDWDGASATFAGSGSAPFTLARAGTGGGRTVMPAYLRYRIPRTAEWDNGYWVDIGGGRIRHSLFSEAIFTSSAVDVANGPGGVIVDMFVTMSGVVANSNGGISANGTNLAGNNCGIDPDTFNVLRAIDVPGIPAGADKEFVVTDGLQSELYPDIDNIRGVYAQAVRVPESTPLTWVEKTPPTDAIVVMGDSLICQVSGITIASGVKGPPYQAWTMLMRENWAGRRVVCEGWGFGTWHERISTAEKRAETVAQLQRDANGTVSNWFWIPLSTNDFGLETYASLVQFEADLVAFGQALAAAGIVGFKAYFVSATQRSDGAVPNAHGQVLADFTTSISNAVTTLANPDILFVDATTYVSLVNMPDGLHYSPTGAVEYEGNARTELGY